MDGKGSIVDVDGPSVLKTELHVPRRDMEKFQEISGNKDYGTYPCRFIQGEARGMDLHIGTTISNNSATLEVACPPPGHGENSGKF